ncbi:MAG: hypothetical protein R3C11_07460 [Planctomycetaceae bacterium]
MKPHIPVRELYCEAQQLVEIARALVFQSKIVVFDEPTSSLTSAMFVIFFKVIKQLKKLRDWALFISRTFWRKSGRSATIMLSFAMENPSGKDH